MSDEYVLIASGSGFGYLLDACSFLKSNCTIASKNLLKITIIYVTRNEDVMEFFSDQISLLIEDLKNHGKNGWEIDATVYLTGCRNVSNCAKHPFVSQVHKRPDFPKLLSAVSLQSRVFFIGNPKIAANVQNICAKIGLSFCKDFTGADENQGDGKTMRGYLKMGVWVILGTIFACILLHLFLFMRRFEQFLSQNTTTISRN